MRKIRFGYAGAKRGLILELRKRALGEQMMMSVALDSSVFSKLRQRQKTSFVSSVLGGLRK